MKPGKNRNKSRKRGRAGKEDPPYSPAAAGRQRLRRRRSQAALAALPPHASRRPALLGVRCAQPGSFLIPQAQQAAPCARKLRKPAHSLRAAAPPLPPPLPRGGRRQFASLSTHSFPNPIENPPPTKVHPRATWPARAPGLRCWEAAAQARRSGLSEAGCEERATRETLFHSTAQRLSKE